MSCKCCDTPFYLSDVTQIKHQKQRWHICALAVDSSGIAPHMGDDHGSLQSYVLYIHIPTYADSYHSRITLWEVQSTWPTDAPPSPYFIYSFSFILSPLPNFTHITGGRMIGPLPLPTTVGFIQQKAVKWSCLTKHTPLNWHLCISFGDTAI